MIGHGPCCAVQRYRSVMIVILPVELKYYALTLDV